MKRTHDAEVVPVEGSDLGDAGALGAGHHGGIRAPVAEVRVSPFVDRQDTEKGTANLGLHPEWACRGRSWSTSSRSRSPCPARERCATPYLYYAKYMHSTLVTIGLLCNPWGLWKKDWGRWAIACLCEFRIMCGRPLSCDASSRGVTDGP